MTKTAIYFSGFAAGAACPTAIEWVTPGHAPGDTCTWHDGAGGVRLPAEYAEWAAAYDDLDAARRFAAQVDVVTFEFENIPAGLPFKIVNRVMGKKQLGDLIDSCYRAYVRGKVESLSLDEPGFSAEAYESATLRARRYFALAQRYAERL